MSLLSSFGIGSASVDLVLPSERVTPGETVDAHVDVEGGTDDQEVDEIYCALRTNYATDEGTHTTTVAEYELTESFAIGADEEQTFDVALDVPIETPTTAYGGTDVWIDTGLDIDWAKDPDDKDELRVDPDPRLGALHDVIGGLGFELEHAGPETATGTPFAGTREFVQVFEYRPIGGDFRGELDELELFVEPREDVLAVTMEVDATDSLLSERETLIEFEVTHDEAGDEDALAERVRERIEANI